MVVRLVSVDEVRWLTCLQQGMWGSSTARFKGWQVGDQLVFVVHKALAAVAEIMGEPFVSDEPVWDDGVFPHRVSLHFTYAILPDVRPTISGDLWDALVASWGSRYGWALASHAPLSDEAAETVLDAIAMRPNSLDAIRANIEGELQRARHLREQPVLRFHAPHRITRLKPKTLPADDTQATESAHTKAQAELIRLGKIAGCSVWVASNDRSRVYDGQALGEGCLRTFPNLGLSKEARDRIALIDTIWIRRDMPVYAFEVEVTSTVYSGLLRMSDLVALVPMLNVKLFIVAPRERQDKVLRELARPTFQKIGLSEFCRFVASEDLAALLAKVSELGGHVQPSVLDTIAVGLEENQTFTP